MCSWTLLIMDEKNCNKSKEFLQASLDCKTALKKSELKKESNRCKSNEFSKPVLNSTLRHLRYMKELETKQYNKTLNTIDLNSVVVKTTNKLNFDAAHTVFKNLISININDSLLLPEKKMTISKKYNRTSDKIPLPELCDFLDPIAAQSHSVPEPLIKLQFLHTEFDFLSTYSRFME